MKEALVDHVVPEFHGNPMTHQAQNAEDLARGAVSFLQAFLVCFQHVLTCFGLPETGVSNTVVTA